VVQSLDKPQQQTVLIVDDEPDNLIVLCELLKGHYHVKVANNGVTGLKIARSDSRPDIILLDIMMPGMDGYEVCRRLKQEPLSANIPVIFLTAKSDPESEAYGLGLGAVDYITKPISPPILLARIKAQLQIKLDADFLEDKSRYLEREVIRRSREVAAIQELTILALASLAGFREHETGNHLFRIQHYIKALAEKLRFNPRFVHFLSDNNINLLFWVAPLHDLGKFGIPDRILLKPGDTRFTPEEFEIVKSHTTLGWRAIRQAEQSLGISVAVLNIAKDVILYHHEKMDGSGYPEGLAGDDIPLSARLMAIADVYDALVSERTYRASMTHEQAVKIIREGRGSHYDADIVDAFVEIAGEFQAIAKRYPDKRQDLPKPPGVQGHAPNNPGIAWQGTVSQKATPHTTTSVAE
jgi:putative two-component system response regulator